MWGMLFTLLPVNKQLVDYNGNKPPLFLVGAFFIYGMIV